jgi:hypothetical protein
VTAKQLIANRTADEGQFVAGGLEDPAQRQHGLGDLRSPAVRCHEASVCVSRTLGA